MSCGCENKRMAQEYERIFRLAKALARMEGKDAVIYGNGEGTYGFALAENEIDKPIIEFVTPY